MKWIKKIAGWLTFCLFFGIVLSAVFQNYFGGSWYALRTFLGCGIIYSFIGIPIILYWRGKFYKRTYQLLQLLHTLYKSKHPEEDSGFWIDDFEDDDALGDAEWAMTRLTDELKEDMIKVYRYYHGGWRYFIWNK